MKDVAESRVKEEVWQIIQELNRAWVMESDTVKLKNYFHKNMVAITATDRYRFCRSIFPISGIETKLNLRWFYERAAVVKQIIFMLNL